MKSKHERIEGEHLFYCFVDFGKTLTDKPEIFVIPSKLVARALRESHEKWLATPGKRGQPHQPTDLRRLRPEYQNVFGDSPNSYQKGWLEPYRDAWVLLGEPQQPVEETSD